MNSTKITQARSGDKIVWAATSLGMEVEVACLFDGQDEIVFEDSVHLQLFDLGDVDWRAEFAARGITTKDARIIDMIPCDR